MHLSKAAMLCVALSGFGLAQQAPEPQASINDPGNSMAIGSAKVEHIFSFVDEGGYQFIAYQVTYKGHPIIVEDPIGSANIAVGGDLRFLIIQHDLSKHHEGGKKVVSFIVGKQNA